MGMESTQSSSARVVGYQGPGSQEGGCSNAKVPPNAKGLVPRKGGAVVLRCLKVFQKKLISASSGAVKPNDKMPALAQDLPVHHVLVGTSYDQSSVYLSFCRCHSNHCQAFP